MPRVLHSPGKGTLVQPVSPGVHASLAASSSGAVAAAVPPADFTRCWQLLPLCPLTHAQATDFIMRQPVSVTSVVPSSAAEWMRSQQRMSSAAMRSGGADAEGDDASDDSLDPSMLAAFDVAHGASPAWEASEEDRSRSGPLPSVSVSEHTATTHSKLRIPAGTESKGSTDVSVASADQAARGGVAAPDSYHSRGTSDGPSRRQPAAAIVRQLAYDTTPTLAVRTKPKPPKDVFAFGSQSSGSRDDSSQPPVTALPEVTAELHSVGPSYTLPSRRQDPDVIVLDSQPIDIRVPAASEPSLRIPASTPASSSGSAPLQAVSVAAAIPVATTDRSTNSTRSLGQAVYTLDPHVILPSLGQLHATHTSAPLSHARLPSHVEHGVVSLHLAKLDAVEADMRRMDAEMAHMAARAKAGSIFNEDSSLSPPLLGNEHRARSSSSPSSKPPPPLVSVGSQLNLPGTSSREVMSDATPPLAQPERGYEHLRTPPSFASSFHHKSTLPVTAAPVADFLGYAADLQAPLNHQTRQEASSYDEKSASQPIAAPSLLPVDPHSPLDMSRASELLATPSSARLAPQSTPSTTSSMNLQLAITQHPPSIPLTLAAPTPPVPIEPASTRGAPATAVSLSEAPLPLTTLAHVPSSPHDAAAAAVVVPSAPSSPVAASLSPPMSPLSEGRAFEPVRTDTAVMASMSLELDLDDDGYIGIANDDADLELHVSEGAEELSRHAPPAEERKDADEQQATLDITIEEVSAHSEPEIKLTDTMQSAAQPRASILVATFPVVAVDAIALPLADSHLPTARDGTSPHSAIDLIHDTAVLAPFPLLPSVNGGVTPASAIVSPQTPQQVHTQPRQPSIVTPPSSVAPTQVLKLSASPARLSAAHKHIGSDNILSAPVEDRCSATQLLYSGSVLVSPVKSMPSPRPTLIHRSPLKRLGAAKQLHFYDKSAVAGAAAAIQPSSSLSFTPNALASDVAASSAVAMTNDPVSPCTPNRSSSSSHQPSFDSTPIAVTTGAPVVVAATCVELETIQKLPLGAHSTASAELIPHVSLTESAAAALPPPVVSPVWSRARKVHDDRLEVVNVEEKSSVPTPTSGEKLRRGKNFSKQATAPSRASDGDSMDIKCPPVISVSSHPAVFASSIKPISISLLSESQPEDNGSQAETSIDPIRRARAKKEADRREAKKREQVEKPKELENGAAAVNVHETKQSMMIVDATILKVSPASSAEVIPTAQPATGVRAHSPIVMTTGRSSTSPSTPSSSDRHVHVPHHYGSSGKKIIVHTRLQRPGSAPKANPRKLDPSPTTLATQQDKSPTSVTHNIAQAQDSPKLLSGAITLVEADNVVARPRAVACLSAILEETSSNASLNTALQSSAAIQAHTSSVHSRPSKPTPSVNVSPSASKPSVEQGDAVPMDIDGTPAIVAATVLPVTDQGLLNAPPTVPAVLAGSPVSSSIVPVLLPSNSLPTVPEAISSRKRARSSQAASPSHLSQEGESPGATGSQIDAEIEENAVAKAALAKRPRRGTVAPTKGSSLSLSHRLSRNGSSALQNDFASSADQTVDEADEVSAASAAPPAKHLRSSLLRGVIFLFTGITKSSSTESTKHAAQLAKMVHQAGGQCVETLKELPHPSDESPQILVLASSPKRTMKFMFSLARGLPPLQPSWLEECIGAGRVMPPTDKQLVPLKEEGGEVSKYPSAWLRSLRDRESMRALPMSKRILAGMRIGVVGASGFVADVSVVCREAGASAWSCEGNDKFWRGWNDQDEQSDAAAASGPPSRSTRKTNKEAAVVIPRIDVVCTDDAQSVTTWARKSLTEGAAGSRSAKMRMPPILSVKWLLQCLMQQKKISDVEREEYLL